MKELNNIFVNGLKFPVQKKSTIKNIIEKLFDLRCEFLISINSKAIPYSEYESYILKENDNLQIVTYSKCCYKLHKRTIFKPEAEKKGK